MVREFGVMVLLLASLLISGCGLVQSTPSDDDSVRAASLEPFSQTLKDELMERGNAVLQDGIDSCFQAGMHAYAQSRVVPVEYEPRENLSFGPWTAEKDYLTTDARDDGSITEWYDNYYITHEWSEYGIQILGLIPGDSVSVNGQSVLVQGIFNYPKDSYYDEVMLVTGADKVVFQTCYPDSDYNRIAWGTLA